MAERTRTGLRLPYDLNTWLVLEAEKRGVTKNALMVQILWQWLESKNSPSADGRGGKSDG